MGVLSFSSVAVLRHLSLFIQNSSASLFLRIKIATAEKVSVVAR
jgi:hypothetical protein